ncbi:SH3 domain-containing protein [Rhodobacter aestuarii]|uniref:SH3 domain-containing protein n=1 Tax=Rhodobacter aestuarii TaxID=453582 RepID=A0A1N7P919_9RHOB|nr:SH3 domain-containing protein [Rhodobacter aestuarii]PTV97671.1 SH3 domain-containing protein [Rhodobacter aestuarii]SIT07071.1 SH3 domain-containing protein [Rhodobacter aestuarii]
MLAVPKPLGFALAACLAVTLSTPAFSQAVGDYGFAIPEKDVLDIRSGPGREATVVGAIARGDVVQLLELRKDWAWVQSSAGASGWVYLPLIAFDFDDILVEEGSCEVVVAWRHTLEGAKQVIESITDTQFTSVFRTEEDKYDISVTNLPVEDAETVMAQWKAEDRIPPTAFCTTGMQDIRTADFVEDMDWRSAPLPEGIELGDPADWQGRVLVEAYEEVDTLGEP